MTKGINCWNRDVVHVDHRLHSPVYDAEGNKGRPWWFEPSDQHSLCYFGVCDYHSYNAWIDATDNYFVKLFIPHYNNVVGAANSQYGGAAMPQDLMDKLEQMADLINGWEAFDKTKKVLKDQFFHTNPMYWLGETWKVSDFFDEMACQMDKLNEILVVDLKRKHMAKGAPSRTVEPVEGGFIGNPAGTESSVKGMSGVGMAVGLVALGAAGYFGFKVLTE